MGLNVVFLGTPDFAVPSLEAIQKSHHHVSAVVTTPDKPAGRGQTMKASAVKEFAESHNLAVFEVEDFKDPMVIRELNRLEPDIMVVVAFKILPKAFYSIPKYGTFNLHASLLPELRGAAPINFAIINGLEETGVTTFYIDEKVDTGNILMQEKVAIDPSETAGTLHDKLMNIGKKVVVKTLDGIENYSLHTQEQDDSKTSYAPKIDTAFCELFWDAELDYLDRKVRGLSPYPGAYTYLKQGDDTKKLKIYRGRIQFASHPYPTGQVVFEEGEMKIAHKEGFYIPTELQLQGKKKMSAKDFINGLQDKEDIRIQS